MSGYLLALSGIAVTFGGLVALFMVVRQLLGGRFTPLDLLAVRNFLSFAFFIASAGLVPHALAALHVGDTLVWRLSSALAMLPIVWHVATTAARRRRALGGQVRPASWNVAAANYASALAALIYGFILIGPAAAPLPGLYVLAATGLMLMTFYGFYATLDSLYAPLGGARVAEPEG